MSAALAREDHYDGAPGAQKKPAQTKAAMVWEDFQTELQSRKGDLSHILPANVRPERFIAAASAAAKNNPDLLFADKRTLFNSVTKAAQDGLLPDGREGVITIYNTKIKLPNGQEEWIKAAQWNPMVYGLRKRAMELGDIIIDAQVVHENDRFVRRQGDNPSIDHEPAPLGTDQGKVIGAYAIFKQGGTILHREVMNAAEIEATRNQSKAKDSLMWTTFKTEGWRKAVIRRGIKTVPVSEDFERIVRREDENFEFERHDAPRPALVPPPAPPSPPKLEIKPAATLEVPAPREPAPILSEADERELDRATMREINGEPAKNDELADWVEDRVKESMTCTSMSLLDALDDQACKELDGAGRDELRTRWNAAYGTRRAILTDKKK